MKMSFKRVYAFRPGFLKPTKNLKNSGKLYAYIGWIYPLLRSVSTNYASTLEEFGKAMIKSVTCGYEKQTLEVGDIIKLSVR